MACVELIGCTSAGKSTLASHILKFCHDNEFDVSLGENFLLDQFHLSRVANFTARALLVNIVSLLVALFSWRKYHPFYSFTFRTITHLQIPSREKVYLFRNILKSIGIYEIAHTRANSGQVILLDEGPLHSANALFVHVAIAPPEGELSAFVQVVPFPDAAVYLREKKEVLIQRTIARRHKRIQSGNRSEVEQFVQSAIALFERLSQEPAVQSILFILSDHQVIEPRGDTASPLQTFILSILHTCLHDPGVTTGNAIKSLHSEILQYRTKIGASREDKS